MLFCGIIVFITVNTQKMEGYIPNIATKGKTYPFHFLYLCSA